MAGTGDLENILIKESEKHGVQDIIKFVGFRDDVLSLMKSSGSWNRTVWTILDTNYPALSKADALLSQMGRTFFGIAGHGVFMDGHFEGYNHLVAVTYIDKTGKETWLPLITKLISRVLLISISGLLLRITKSEILSTSMFP